MDITSVQFNDIFAKELERQKQEQKKVEEQKLKDLDTKYKKTISDMTIYDILKGLKNTWLGIFNELIHMNISLDMLTKENRFFFIGLTIVILALISLLIKH